MSNNEMRLILAGFGGQGLLFGGKVIAYAGLRLFLSDSGGIPPQLMGVLFGGVAGIMVYISLDELLPASRAYGKGHDSLLGLVAGMVMMALSLLLMK